MGIAEAYTTACVAAGTDAQPALVDALASIDAKSTDTLQLQAKGSLQPTLPQILLTDADVSPLCEALQSADAVKSLVLTSNQITDAGCDAIAGLLEKSKSLVSVDLGFNDFGAVGAQKIANSLLVRSGRCL